MARKNTPKTDLETSDPAKQASADTRPRSKYASRGSWKPGQSGNPRGRPKKRLTIADWLKHTGDQEETLNLETGRIITHKEALARAAYLSAIEGDVGFFRQIIRLLDGPPTQQLAKSLSMRDVEDETVRSQMKAILDAVENDPVRRQQVLDLMEKYFEIEAELAALSTHKETGNGSDIKE